MRLLNNKKEMLIISAAASIALIFLDQSSIGVLLKNIQTDLNASDFAIRWIVNAYILTLSVLLLFGGQIADIFCPRKIFTIGLLLFCFASLLCSISSVASMLIIARILQGLGASLVMPSTLVLINTGFPENERGKAMGTAVAIGSIFFASGPIIGGVVTQLLSWRWIFLINIPVGVVSILFAYLSIPKYKREGKSWRQIDLSGLVIFAISVAALIAGLMEASKVGWNNKWIVSLFVIFSSGIILFYLTEINKSNPLIHFNLFRKRNFFVGNLILFSIQVCVVSVVYWALWFEEVMKFSPLLAGLAILPGFVPAMVLSRWAGSWLDKRGSRQLICWGTLLVALGVVWISLFSHTNNYCLVFIGMLSYGVGAAITIPNSVTTVLASVDPWQKGMAAGTLNTMRQLGGAIGLAIIGVMMSNFILVGDDKAYSKAFSSGMLAAGIFGFISSYLAYRYLENK